MATIEDIAQSIIKDAEKKADEILKSYEAETKQMLSSMEKEHMQKLKEIDEEKAEAEAMIKKKLKYEHSAIISNAETLGKSEFFEELINSASEAIISMRAADYCVFLEKILSIKNPPPGSTFFFGKNDSTRLGKDFFQKISKKYNAKIEEGNVPYGVIIHTPTYIDKVTPETIVYDKKAEIMQILGRYEASL